MSELTNPSDIARETLRQLASRRIAPNPDNYRQHYQQIAGQPDAAGDAERMLLQLAADLRAQPNTARLAGALDKAAGEKNWTQYRTALLELIEAKLEGGEAFTAEEQPRELDGTEDVSDLLAKLEASVKARSGDGRGPAKKTTSRKAPAKKAPAKNSPSKAASKS